MAVCKSGIPYYTIVTTAAAAAPAHESSSSNAMATLGERGSGGTCKVQPLPDRPTEASSFPNFRNQHMSEIGPGGKESCCWPGFLFSSFCLRLAGELKMKYLTNQFLSCDEVDWQ